MTRAELTQDLMAQCSFLDEAQANQMVTLFCEEITAAVARGEKVMLSQFGAFALKVRAARLSRNPQTGQKVSVPAKQFMAFKPSKMLLKYLDIEDRT